jgi:hypothetical protein
MNQYRVSLWRENQGDIPDMEVQFQVVGAESTPSKLAVAAFFLADKVWARWVKIEMLNGGQWLELARAFNVTLHGTPDVWFSSSQA